MIILLLLLFATFHYVPSFNVPVAVDGRHSAGDNPFTPKAYLIRYWDKQITNNLPKPSFLLDKASPLTAAQTAAFSKLAAGDCDSLSANLSDFCTKANLLCFPDLTPSLEKHNDNVNFTSYVDGRNFTNYGTDRLAGADSFKNYSGGANDDPDTFSRYSRDSAAHKDEFAAYATHTNVANESFKGYATTSTGGNGKFTNYDSETNVPNLRFAAYSSDSSNRKQTFAGYSDDANHGEQKFTSYGKNSNGAGNDFTSYGKNSNVMGSNFDNYGETGNGGNDTFTSYGYDTNVPENTFKNYGADANGAVQSFKSYRQDSNTGEDGFQSYGKKSNAAATGFENYGQSYNGGSLKFTGYGKDAVGQTVDFKIYGHGTTFKEYANKEGVTFASYINESSSAGAASLAAKGKRVNMWVVEPGKFFRECMLKSGSVMPMPDIRDKMPKRSFLPRMIISKLPFSTSKIREMKRIFHADNESNMANIITNSLSECERKPSPNETKRCVASIEDMIDFSTSVLGRNVAVHTTENTRGSNGNITIGQVRGVNGGNVTKSVSCHQSLFPYMLYYCHSVPKVRVYEADILDPRSKSKINNGVAICHLDTSSWSPGHGAFIALGSGPGKIEVCHWIFENDMTWTIAD